MLKDLLQGKPWQHPVHPALIHFPIGLFVLSVILDVASLVDETTTWLVPAAAVCLLGGILMAVLAAIPGLVDWADIRADHPAKKKATLHMILNLFAVAVFALGLGIRTGALNETAVPILPFLLSLLGVGVIMVSGYLGGVLIYELGIAVGRHRRRTDTPDHTLRAQPNGATAASLDGYQSIGALSDLENGETARAEIDGQIVAIVRLDGELYAFQEFCPHQYGPLSEGSIRDGQIQCPWHGSCFDIRSGKVTRGPARDDLRTYAVSVQANQVYVRVAEQPSKPTPLKAPEQQRV